MLDGQRTRASTAPRRRAGGDVSAWARWTRGWTSEENRHGDLLNKLLYLCGQVDMGAVERSIQGLIGTGFDPSLGDDAYRCFVYTSFQERATKVSHGNTAALARAHGATDLAAACRVIGVRLRDCPRARDVHRRVPIERLSGCSKLSTMP